MSVLPDSLAGWVVVAVLLFWFVGAYNRLVRLRAAVLQAYATLDAALARQLDFVQTSLSAPSAAEESTDAAAGAKSLRQVEDAVQRCQHSEHEDEDPMS